MLSIYIVAVDLLPSRQFNWNSLPELFTVFRVFLSQNFGWKFSHELLSMSHTIEMHDSWIIKLGFEGTSQWRRVYCFMSHRGFDKNYLKAVGNTNFQFSIFNSCHNQSSFITVTWCVFSRTVFCLFSRSKPVVVAQSNPQINYRGEEPSGSFYRFSRGLSSVSLALSVNQKALYHNFPSHSHSFFFLIAITNKNTCVKLKDTQNSRLDW